MLKYCISFWLLSATQIVIGQTHKAVIPFQLPSFNNIVIAAILNQKDTIQLMLHTAASDITLTEEATKKLKSVAFENAIDSIKSWGGEANAGRFSEHNYLEINGLRWDSLSITENKHSGQFSDGKFGLNLFGNKYIAFDYEEKIITISEKLPKRMKGYKQYKISFENDFMFIEGNCETERVNQLRNQFLIHSGYAGSILLDDQFVYDNKLSEKLIITGEKQLKDSYGNIIKVQKAILPIFSIGSINLKDVPVGFFSGAMGNQKISVIGGDILKRFHIIIDAKREFIYLKPNEYFKMPYTKV